MIRRLTRARTWKDIMRNLVAKRDRGEITAREFAERKARIVTTRLIYQTYQQESKR